MSHNYDFDFIVVGSGFGGSVSAMRLTEKGYSVGIIEQGKRYRKDDFGVTSWSLRKYLWAPKALCHGIMKITLLNDVLILSGAGVGGGSLVYANTLLVPPKSVFSDKRWGDTEGWFDTLQPHYDTAQRMLGVVDNPHKFEGDRFLKEVAEETGRGDTVYNTRVGVYFGESGQTVKDPFFGGEGPDRTGCTLCGGCMVGCRYGAKNTLDQNYLYFAEKNGAKVIAERRVVDIIELPEGGYELHTERSTTLLRKDRAVYRARQVVLSAGVLGTMNLLLKCKENGHLSRLSPALGKTVRTNSEAIVGATSMHSKIDHTEGIAITSGFYPEPDTHVEVVRYSKGSDSMNMLSTILTDDGTKLTRPLKFFGEILKHPLHFLHSVSPFGWAKRTIVLLVMQTTESSMSLLRRRRWFWPFGKLLSSEPTPGETPIPTFIPAANDTAKRMAKKMGGYPISSVTEVMLNVPTTAHILGGAIMGPDDQSAVVDKQNRVFGYEGLYVIDGSMIPVNLGVNPSLTITALAEHAMSHVPPKGEG